MSAIRLDQLIGQFRAGPAIGKSGLYIGFDLAAQGKTGEPSPVWLQLFDPAHARHLDDIHRQFAAWTKFKNDAFLPLVGFEPDPPLLAVQRSAGELLSHRLGRKHLDTIEAAKLIAGIGQAVAEAHRDGLVNLGISEQRIVVPELPGEPPPHFFGFGVGFAPERLDSVDWAYLAPEQITSGSDSDQRADVYALGVLLLRSLTGEFPIALPAEPTPEKLVAVVVSGERRDPGRWLPRPLNDLSAIIRRATHPHPKQRYANAGEFVEALIGSGILLRQAPPSETKTISAKFVPPVAVPQHRAPTDAKTLSPQTENAGPQRHVHETTPTGRADDLDASGKPKTLVLVENDSDISHASASTPDTSGVAVDDPMDLLNKELCGYRFESLLGEGGMGAVYLATMVQLRLHRAIKVADRHLVREALERFNLEAHVIAELNRAGVPRVVEVQLVGNLPDGRPFIDMKYIPGKNLSQLLKEAPQGRLPLTLAIELFDDLAETLEAAHDLKIVHRDVKPTNVIVQPGKDRERERAWLLDFGVARWSGDQKDKAQGALVTRATTLLGTPGFMAPEQLLGSPVGGRADVFALTALLYEMLTGQRAFTADEAVVKREAGEDSARAEELRLALVKDATLNQTPPPISKFRRDTPAALDQLIAAGLARKEQDRPAMAEWRKRLNALAPKGTRLTSNIPVERPLDDRPTNVRTEQSVADFLDRLPQKRNYRGITVAGTILCVLVILGIVATYRKHSQAAAPTTPATASESSAVPATAQVLQTAQAKLRISTVPSDAELLVDGRLYTGTQPALLQGRPHQQFIVEARRKGYQSLKEELTLTEVEQDEHLLLVPVESKPSHEATGSAANAATQLQTNAASSSATTPPTTSAAKAIPSNGTLRIYVNPWAMVYIDGKARGQTPFPNLPLAAGSHVVRLVNDEAGYPKDRAFQKRVTIHSGKIEKIDLNWSKE